MDKVPKAWIREHCREMKWMNKRIDDGVFLWFNHVERMDYEGTAKKDCVGEYVGS